MQGALGKYVDFDDSIKKVCMKVIVLGGDGFCGWPTALGLSK